MNLREILGCLLGALLLLVAAALIYAYRLWSFLGNYTMPWFCCALAVGLVLVVVTSLLTGKSLAAIPPSRVAIVVVGSSVGIGVGMVLDGLSYARALPNDWVSSVGEVAAFTLILIVLFWIPRLSKRAAEPAGAPDEEDAAGDPSP